MPLELIAKFAYRLWKMIDITLIGPVTPIVKEEVRQFYFEDLFSLEYALELSKGTIFTIFHSWKIPPMVWMNMTTSNHTNLFFDSTDIIQLTLYSQPDIFRLWHPNGNPLDLRGYEEFPDYRWHLQLTDFPLFSTNYQKLQIAREALNIYDDQMRAFKEESLMGILRFNLTLWHNLHGRPFTLDNQLFLNTAAKNFFSTSEFIMSYERLRFQWDLTVAADFNPAFFDEALQLISNR